MYIFHVTVTQKQFFILKTKIQITRLSCWFFVNLTHFSPALFHIETSHLFHSSKMTGFYMKRKTGLKWVNQFLCCKNLNKICVKIQQNPYVNKKELHPPEAVIRWCL